MAVIISVVTVYDYRDVVDTGFCKTGDKKSLSREESMRIAKELIIYEDLEAAADA